MPSCTHAHINGNSTPMSTNPTSTTTVKSDEGDSLNNGLLFQPVIDPKCDYVLHHHHRRPTTNTLEKEPFFLSLPKSSPNGDESTMTQTSTLIISTPPQYHYYLYPPINNTHALSSSASSASSSTSSSSLSAKKAPKMISTANRTISNVSINSVSTSSSSSYPSYECQTPENDGPSSSQTPLHPDDETLSSSTNSIKTRQKRVVQSALIDWKMKTSSSESPVDLSLRMKPVILSDSVQAFWPPPPPPTPSCSSFDNDPGPNTVIFTTDQVCKRTTAHG